MKVGKDVTDPHWTPVLGPFAISFILHLASSTFYYISQALSWVLGQAVKKTDGVEQTI